MVFTCKYDKVADLKEVDQFGYINLIECLSNGSVPSFVSNTEDAYNDIDDPSTIIGKPTDVFDAINMQSYVKNVGKKQDTKE